MNIKKVTSVLNIISYVLFAILAYRLAGATAIGIFSAAIAFVYVIYTVFCGGVKYSISKMVATRLKRGFNENAKKVFNYSFIYMLFISVIFALICFFSGDGLSNALYKCEICGGLFLILGFYFIVLSFSEDLRGYYYGCGGNILMFVGDIIKDIVVVVAGPFIINYMNEYGLKISALKNSEIIKDVYSALGISITITLSFTILFLIFLAGKSRLISQDSFSFNEVRSKDGVNAFIRSFVPAAVKKLRDLIFPVFPIFICILLFIRSNNKIGLDTSLLFEHLSFFTALTFIIIIIFNMIFKEFCNVHYLKLRVEYKKEDKKALSLEFNSFVKTAITNIVPIVISLVTFSGVISRKVLLCNSDSATKIAIICSFALLFSLIDIVLSTYLQAVSLELNVFVGNIIAFVIQMIFVVAMSKTSMKITSAAVSLLLFYLITTTIHLVFTIGSIDIKINDLIAKLIKVGIAAVPMIIIDFILAKFVSMNLVIAVICCVIGFLVFSIVLIVIKGINQKDINNMQGSAFYTLYYLLGSIFHVR